MRYRDQWNKVVKTAYSTALFQADFRIYQSNLDCLNIGFIAMNDRTNTGLLKTNNMAANIAYSRKLSNHKLSNIVSFGATVSYYNTNINSTNLWFGRQYDLSQHSINTSIESGETFNQDDKNYLSVDAGVRWIGHLSNSYKLQASAAIFHLNRPSNNLFELEGVLPSRYYSNVEISKHDNRYHTHKLGAQATVQSKSFQINPYYILTFKVQDLDDFSLNIGLGCRISSSHNGVLLDAIIPTLGIASSKWQAQLAYDINVSSLSSFTRNAGALELSLGYFLKTQSN